MHYFEGNNVYCKEVYANSVKLTGYSEIEVCHCEATLMLQHMHNRQDCGKEYNIREMGEMVNTTIRKILDLCQGWKKMPMSKETMLSSLGS